MSDNFMNIDAIIEKHPKLSFLKSPAFAALPKEKREFLLGCVEDAIFWVDLEQRPCHSDDGFKFLAATYGLQKAHVEADAKSLTGDAREEFLRSPQDLYTKFNPFGDRRDSGIN